MKKKKWISFGQLALCLLVCFAAASPGYAQDALRFSSSAQLYDIIQQKTLDEFTAQTGVKVDLFISSSEAAMHRLYNQVCDVAGTAEHIYFSLGDYGYTETPLCRAPLVVITNSGTSIENVTEDQLRNVFSGSITNWKALGGPDQAIVVVVPGKDTAALKNFSQLALKRFDIRYDIMTYRSTMVVEVVRHIPGSISFITKGSKTRDASIRILKVNGYAHTETSYPYFQSFSLVTKGTPSGAAKSFIDFLTSEKTKSALIANGIFPREP
jgi:phosphate transport system substrate-binding protein